MVKYFKILSQVAAMDAAEELDFEIRERFNCSSWALLPFLRLVAENGTYHYRTTVFVRWNPETKKFEWLCKCTKYKSARIGHPTRVKVEEWIPIHPSQNKRPAEWTEEIWLWDEVNQLVQKSYVAVERFRKVAADRLTALRNIVEEFFRVIDALSEAMSNISMREVWGFVDECRWDDEAGESKIVEYLQRNSISEEVLYTHEGELLFRSFLKYYGLLKFGMPCETLEESKEKEKRKLVTSIGIPKWMR